jgi:hypothetical protein
MENLPPEIICYIAGFTGEEIIPFSLTCKNFNQILKTDVEKFRLEYDPFYKFDINDIEDKYYSIIELQELEDFQNGKIDIIKENGEVLGYNKEKDVYYHVNFNILVFDLY